MSYFYTEEDSLLPKGSQAPEICDTQPEDIKDDYYLNPECRDGVEEGQSRNLRSSISTVFIICLALISSTILLTNGFFDKIWPETSPKTIDQRVHKILSETPLIDGHNDLAWLIRAIFDNKIYSENFTKPFEKGPMPYHVDLPRLKRGNNGGAFWSAYIPCPANWSDFSDGNYAASVASTLSQIDLLNRLHSAYPSHFSPSQINSTSALTQFHSNRLISPIGIEGLHQIGNSLSNLRLYHSLGVHYATLTHNCHNIYADSALSELPSRDVEKAKPHWGGLSPAGKELIREMNRMGMIVDLAHVSQDTMLDVLDGTSLAPIIFSHSSAYALCPHPRNVPDSILKLVKATNSVVMVNFSPDFISCMANSSNPSGIPDFYPRNNTLEQVARHVIYIGELIGYEHVGLGSDFDGIGSTPKGLEDVSKFPDLVAELLRRGVKDEDAKKVVGGNILRAWRDVERVAEKLQKSGVMPVEDRLPHLRIGSADSKNLGMGVRLWEE